MKKFGMVMLFVVFAFSSAAFAKSETKKANTATVVKKEEVKIPYAYAKATVSGKVESLKFQTGVHPRDWPGADDCLRIIDGAKSQIMCVDRKVWVGGSDYGRITSKIPYSSVVKQRMGNHMITLKVSITKWEVSNKIDIGYKPFKQEIILHGNASVIADNKNMVVNIWLHYAIGSKKIYSFSKVENEVYISDMGKQTLIEKK